MVAEVQELVHAAEQVDDVRAQLCPGFAMVSTPELAAQVADLVLAVLELVDQTRDRPQGAREVALSHRDPRSARRTRGTGRRRPGRPARGQQQPYSLRTRCNAP